MFYQFSPDKFILSTRDEELSRPVNICTVNMPLMICKLDCFCCREGFEVPGLRQLRKQVLRIHIELHLHLTRTQVQICRDKGSDMLQY